MEELDCANCAAKMETVIGKIEGVKSVSVNYMAQKLTLEADDESFSDILHQAELAIRKIEPDTRIVRR